MFYSHESTSASSTFALTKHAMLTALLVLNNSQYGVATIWYGPLFLLTLVLSPRRHHAVLESESAATADPPTSRLAATIGRNSSAGKGVLRRLTRKAVQGVDVPKACETIINPGAPLALRLQSSLLYGVSRVFAEQCRYMLSDAEKTQSDMKTFFRVLQTNETDPRAGKTK